MEEKLADKTARLSTLSRHLVEAQEDARRRLSRELHDHTSPNLAAININLGLIDKALTTLGAARLKEQIADTIALVEDTNSSIREISADLRSPVLDHAGLCAAMEAYGNHYQRRTGIEVNVTCPSQVKRLDPTLESMLFRVFQEALTNTLKHANATAVTVSMLHENEAVELIIADDGDGFSMANPAPAVGAEATGDVGMGMITMLETIELIGGSLRIDSVHGAGVHIVVRVPL
jgi:signal transduction histidine kinase